MSLFNELKRRNVFRVGAMYIVVAWLILQIADVVLGNIGSPTWVFQSILLILILAAPLALLFAWAFELTPEGLKREQDVDRTDSVTHQTGRKLDRMIIVVLVLALGYFAVDKYTAGRDASVIATTAEQPASNNDEKKSIAVLPFVNMSSDPEQEYFSDGISEELLNLLANIPEFRVAGRTSSFAFKGQNDDLRKIGESLGVTSILEGSVRKGGVRVRITAQLVNVDDGFHLWSDTYDRELTDIFAVQDEIAAAVVAQLKVTLLGDAVASRATDVLAQNVAAYDAYLRGLSHMRLIGPEPYGRAAEAFEQAVALAPESALAWASLAYASAKYSGFIAAGKDAAMDRAIEAVTEALQIADDVPEAYTALAYIRQSFDMDWPAAEAALERALELRAGDILAMEMLSNLYYTQGRLEDAIDVSREALAQDPLNLSLESGLALQLVNIGEIDKGTAMLRRLIEQSGTNSFLPGLLAFALWLQGDYDEALESGESESVPYMRYTVMAIVLKTMGNDNAARNAQQQLLEEYGDDAAYQQAYISMAWGNAEEAMAWLERAFEDNDPGVTRVKSDRAFRDLHDEPRFIALLKNMNLAD